MNLKVKYIVKVIQERSGKLVAGHNGLDREILYFDVMEQPNMKPWMREGVILITTGYAIKDNKEALLTLIKDLNESKAAALAIKTRFFDKVPDEIIPLANQLNFPLFFLEDNASFIDITYPIMTAIVESKNEMNALDNYIVNNEYKRNRDTKLFIDLLNEKITKTNEIEYKINFHNWPKGKVRLAVIKLTTKKNRKYLKKDTIDNLYDFIVNFMEENNKKHAIALKNNKFICFISDKDNKEKTKEMLLKLNENIEKKFMHESRIGVSETIHNYFAVKETYKDVKDAILIGNISRINKNVLFIEDYKFEQLLVKLSKDESIQNFAIEKLKLLEEHDIANESQLLETLHELIKSRGSRKEAALNLYLHRNTLAYRIKKIEQITGYSLSDCDNLFQIEFALKLKDYI